MPQPTTLNELMDHLAAKQWPAADRAIVYTEWRNLVRASLVRPPPTEEDVFHEGIANRAKEALLGLDNLFDFQKNSLPLSHILGIEGRDIEEKKTFLAKVRRGLGKEMEENGWCNWTDYVTSLRNAPPSFYNDYRGMEMDEEDLTRLMQSDRMGLTELPSVNSKVSLEDAQGELTKAFEKSGFHRLEVPALDAEDPDRLMAIAACLNTLSNKFTALGGNDIRLGTPNSTMFLGIDRAGSSGYCTGKSFVGCAPKTGFPLIEVLAHECLHMHDYAMHTKEVTLDSHSANSKRLGAWSRLFAHLHESLPVDESQNTQRWNQAKESLTTRWSATMGLPKEKFDEAYASWQTKSLTTKRFRQQLSTWFREAGRGDTSDFRADVVLAECNLIKRASAEKPVWQQFTYGFEKLLSTSNTGVYSADYFSANCEIAARAFQMLFSDDAPKENPFAQRWLVFPGQDELPHIKKAWTDFFKDEAVRGHYTQQSSEFEQMGSPRGQGGFSSALAARRSSQQTNKSVQLKKAALS